MTSIGDRIAKQYMLEKEMERKDLISSFLGRSLNDESRVIIQIIKPANANDREELLLGLQKLETLKHPNLETPLASGETQDGEIFVVTRMEGLALNKLIPKDEGLTLTGAWPILSQIAEGLSAAHKQGLFHFELNPMNVLVETNEEGDEIVKIRWLVWGNLETDLVNFKALANFMLEGKKLGAIASSSLVPMQHFASVQSFMDALSEIHRKQMLVPQSHDEESPPENVVDFSLGRFIVASVVVMLMGCTLLLYYWLTSST